MLRTDVLLFLGISLLGEALAFTGGAHGGGMMLRGGHLSVTALQMGGKGFGSPKKVKKATSTKAPATGDVDLGSLVSEDGGRQRKKSQIVSRMEKKLVALENLESEEEIDEEEYAQAIADAQKTTRRMGREALERGEKF
mmetsp:Transcript_5716/g.13203  ORF Transcript_5716/g.13203 Transcript_5716/m.13203 type:complete len:139 (+) Transcript_5716:50-466(+)